MVNAQPKVTVLMPVYNGAPFLRESVGSILQQSFSDFEFLIVDDGSTDGSAALVEAFSDPRIRLVRNGMNRGLIASLNLGLGLARGEYLARMDADDVSLPERLQRQVEFMERHPEVAVCGSWLEAFGAEGDETLWSPPLTDQQIKASLLFESVIYHPTVMMRRKELLAGPVRYDPSFAHAEDYELWGRMAGSWRFANLGEVLLRYRLHDQSIGRRESAAQAASAGKVREMQLARLGIAPTQAELELHHAISTWRIDAEDRFLEKAQEWLLKLLQANREQGVLSQQELEKSLARRWYEVCRLALPMGSGAYRHYFDSPLSRYWRVPLRERLAFRVRAFCGTGRTGSGAGN